MSDKDNDHLFTFSTIIDGVEKKLTVSCEESFYQVLDTAKCLGNIKLGDDGDTWILESGSLPEEVVNEIGKRVEAHLY